MTSIARTEGTARWPRTSGWVLMALLATGVAVYGLTLAFNPAARPPFFADSPVPWALAFHFAGGGTALFVGAWQFATGPRGRWKSLHRWMGRIYVIAALFGIGAGLVMAPFSQTGLVARIGFTGLALATLFTTVRGWLLIRAGRTEAHRQWMIRSYALMLAAVSLRIQLPLSQMTGIAFSLAYPVIAWSCWVPNLAAAEWIIARRSRRVAA